MKIGIIGCGVNGLSTGITLLGRGYQVEILAKETSPDLVSDVAAGFWLPYRVEPEQKVRDWGIVTYEFIKDLLSVPEAGVYEATITHLGIEEAMQGWWEDVVPDHRKLSEDELHGPYRDGSTYTTILMDSTRYMPYLRGRFESAGGRVTIEEVSNIAELSSRFDTVVNCSGVSAFHLCNDKEVYPIRGQVLRVKPPESMKPSIWECEGSFAVCRREDCIIGGANADGDWSLEIRDEDRALLLERIAVLVPELADPEIIEDRVGLRPGRASVRLEVETLPGGERVVHNYGHGGGGYTLSWGCANEVADLIAQ